MSLLWALRVEGVGQARIIHSHRRGLRSFVMVVVVFSELGEQFAGLDEN